MHTYMLVHTSAYLEWVERGDSYVNAKVDLVAVHT
jgi:hypothetical protein